MGRPRILDSTEKTCKDCHGIFTLNEFGKTGKYYRRICKACYYQKHEAHRLRNPEINKRACKKYYHKKTRCLHRRCFTCAAVVQNITGYCLHCYFLDWIRCQWRNFTKHTIGDQSAKERRDILKTLFLEMTIFPHGNKFPAYRLRHIKSVKFYPELAFRLDNIHWVPVNTALSRLHVKRSN